MSDQTIVAVYDTPAHAELAVQDLLAANVPESAIHRHAQEGSYAGTNTAPSVRSEEGTGFWASLFGGEPDHDATVYDRSVSSGSNAVSVKVPDEHVARVMEILESHAPIDIDERASSYGLSQTVAPRAPGLASTGSLATGTTSASTTGTLATGNRTASATDAGTIQLSEEALAVGKRVVNRGTTRVRRFVVETPVEESVKLHEERVTVERIPVTDGRAASTNFGDKVIEMTESAEEAVVSKTAHVTEEIRLHKEATDRTETVRDTLKREDVEITQVPGTTTTTETLGTTRKPGL